MIKQSIPWPIKVGVKLALGAARVDYRWLKRIRVVEFGKMEDARFATEIFERHVDSLRPHGSIASKGALLELGPGDSITTGILALAAGFTKAVLIDVGCYADLRPEMVDRLFVSLGAKPLALALSANRAEVLERLRHRGINYMTDGLESLASIDRQSITHSFSNAVLQHVNRDELPDLIRLLGQVHAGGTPSSHAINFTDHFSGGFMNHKVPDWLIESALVKRSNLYTNRVSLDRYLELFQSAGLVVTNLTVELSGDRPQQARSYTSAGEFREYAADRRVLKATIQARKSDALRNADDMQSDSKPLVG